MSAPVLGDVSSKDVIRRTAEVSELQMTYDILVAQWSTFNSECGTLPLLSRERSDNSIIPRASRHTFEDEFKPLERQIAVVQVEKEAVAVEQNASNAKLGSLRTLISRYRIACSHVAKRLSDERVCLGTGRKAAAYKTENDVTHFLRGHFILRKDHMRLYISRSVSMNKRSSTVGNHCGLKNSLHNSVSGHLVLNDNPLDFGRLFLSRSTLSLCWINAEIDGTSFAVQPSEEIQSAGSSRSKRNRRIPPRQLTKRQKISTMQSRYGALKASLDHSLVIDLERDRE